MQEVNTQSPDSAPAPKKAVAVIPAWGPKRLWFTLGVVAGGGLLAVGLMADGLDPGRALLAGVCSSGSFLLAFDRAGEFQFLRALPAIAVAAIAAATLKMPVMGGFAGYLAFLACGWVGVGIAYLIIKLFASRSLKKKNA